MPLDQLRGDADNRRFLHLMYKGLVATCVVLCAFLWKVAEHQHALNSNQVADNVVRRCTLHNDECFDFSRCHNGVGVYIYKEDDEPFWSRIVTRLFAVQELLLRFDRRVIASLRSADSGIRIVTDPSEACIFVPRVASCLSVNQCPLPLWLEGLRLRALPFWNKTGRNHVLLDHFDSKETSHLPPHVRGTSISIRSATSVLNYRKGFDVALSLPGKLSAYRYIVSSPESGQSYTFFNRDLLVGFIGAPTTSSEDAKVVGGLRQSLASLHNPESRVHVTVRQPMCQVPCKMHAPDYRDEYRRILLRSRFQIVPRGNGLHSHRLLESLSAGTIPIILADEIVLPFHEIIPWHLAVVKVMEKNWRKIPEIALEIEGNREAARDMQCAGLAIYYNFFLRPGGGTIGLAFRLLQSHIHSSTFSVAKSRKISAPLLPDWPTFRKPKLPIFCKESNGWKAVEVAVEALNA